MRASRYANRCESSEEAEIERQWHVGREQPGRWWDEVLFPRGHDAFIRRSTADPNQRELAAVLWG